jgi:hypothetical protein
MFNESGTINEIESKARIFNNWTIGITNDPDARKQAHGNPLTWYQWKAPSEGVARRIERYFLDKGMKGDTSKSDYPTYVYIF